MGEIEGEGGYSLSGAAVIVRGVNGSGSTARGSWCVTKATRRAGVFEEKWMRSNLGRGCGRGVRSGVGVIGLGR